jgi:hypothetical protein
MASRKIDAIIIALFPAILTIGIVMIPVVKDYSDHILAEEAVSQTQRWLSGHMISSIAFGISIISAYIIAAYLSKKGQKQAGLISFALIAVGGTLYAFGLGADGIGPLATMMGGSNAAVFFDGSGIMVSGAFISATLLFGFGVIYQIIGLYHAGLLKRPYIMLTLIGAVFFMGASAIPSGWGLYAVAISTIIIYVPISLLLRESA